MEGGKIEVIAKAICDAAGRSVSKASCIFCVNGQCSMWKEFREEARAAAAAYKRWEMKKVS